MKRKTSAENLIKGAFLITAGSRGTSFFIDNNGNLTDVYSIDTFPEDNTTPILHPADSDTDLYPYDMNCDETI